MILLTINAIFYVEKSRTRKHIHYKRQHHHDTHRLRLFLRSSRIYGPSTIDLDLFLRAKFEGL